MHVEEGWADSLPPASSPRVQPQCTLHRQDLYLLLTQQASKHTTSMTSSLTITPPGHLLAGQACLCSLARHTEQCDPVRCAQPLSSLSECQGQALSAGLALGKTHHPLKPQSPQIQTQTWFQRPCPTTVPHCLSRLDDICLLPALAHPL